MCGRYVEDVRKSDFISQFHQYIFDFLEAMDGASRFNIAPTTTASIRRWSGGERQIATCRWGLLPVWAKDEKYGNRLINARSETAREKPSFRTAFKKRRCLVLATGYYEWKKSEGGKQPHLIHLPQMKPFLMLGLWEQWFGTKSRPLDDPIESYTILTTSAADHLADLHDRMPCTADIESEFLDSWLDPRFQDNEFLDRLLAPSPDFVATAVSTYVNNVRNQGPQCVAQLPG